MGLDSRSETVGGKTMGQKQKGRVKGFEAEYVPRTMYTCMRALKTK